MTAPLFIGEMYTLHQVTPPDSGSLTASFWLKDGQSICVDGFPLLFGNYYQVSENNDTMNQEGYITHIIANETINQYEADALIIQGIQIISKTDKSSVFAQVKDKMLMPMTADAGKPIILEITIALLLISVLGIVALRRKFTFGK